MLLSDLVGKTKETEFLFSNVFKKAMNKPAYKRALMHGMYLTCRLPDSNLASQWILQMNKETTKLKSNIDELKKEFLAHRIASLTNASVALVGVANFWNPIGWGLMGASGVSEIANIVTENFISKQKKVDKSIEYIQKNLNAPFESISESLSNFIIGYKNLSYYIGKTVGDDNINEILNVIFGCMYLLDCHTNPRNIEKVWGTWTICYDKAKINIYSNSTFNSIIAEGFKLKEKFEVNNIFFGTGVSILCLCKMGPRIGTQFINQINKTMALNILIPTGLTSILRTIGKATIGITAVLSLLTIITDSIEVHKIDKKYEPYYELVQKIEDILFQINSIPIEFTKHVESVKRYSILVEFIKNNINLEI